MNFLKSRKRDPVLVENRLKSIARYKSLTLLGLSFEKIRDNCGNFNTGYILDAVKIITCFVRYDGIVM